MTKNKKSGGKKDAQGQDNSKSKASKKAGDTNGVNQGSKSKSIPKPSNSNAMQSSTRPQQQPKSPKQPKAKSKASPSTSSNVGLLLGIVVVILAVAVAGVGVYFMSEDAQEMAGNVYSRHVEPVVVKARNLINDILQSPTAKAPSNNIPHSEDPNEGENVKRLKEKEERERREREESERKEKERKAEMDRKRKEKEEAEKKSEQDRKEAEEKRRKEREEIERKAEKERKEKERKAEEERKKREKEEAERKAEIQRREKEKQEEEERKRKEKEESDRKAEKERKEKERKEEEARKKKEKEDAEKKAELERKKKEEAERKAEQERKEKERKEEEERKRKEKEEAERKAEKERKEKEMKEDEERKRREKEEAERKAEMERKEKERKEEEERKRKEKEEAERKAEKERKEKEMKEEKERKRREKEEAERKVEMERKEKERKEEEERKRKEKEEVERKAEKERQEKERKEEAERKRRENEEADRKAEKERKEKQRREEEERRRKEEGEAAKDKIEKERKAEGKKKKDMDKKVEEEAKVGKVSEKKNQEKSKSTDKKNVAKDDVQNQKQKEADAPYEFASITNANDFKIKDELDEADRLYDEEDFEGAIRKYDSILVHSHLSPRAMYGKGLTLDKLGFKHMSNEYLEQAINFLNRLLLLPDVPDKLFLEAGRKLAERQHFRGWGSKAVKTFTLMLERFPEDVKLRCELGVTYMLIGRNAQAKDVFEQVLEFDPNSGFAKAHIGFIYKTSNNDLVKAIPLLRDGIESREEGTSDGRFYIQLGDALIRVGQEQEARHYFKEAETKGLFLSQWQRSLYNVKELTGRPFWTAKQSGYAKYIEMLEKNWKTIRDEGMAQLDEKLGLFRPEDENLRDTGEWKQFTLYQQGRKNQDNCAKVPKTCAIIDQIPPASGCKRGQVKFSVMSPGIHVWPHTGPTNCRLRSHLGLVVPEGPLLRVVNETRTWTEGKVMTFDDSFEHEVWHKGSKWRLILIVDFWHPELTERQRRTLSAI